jgi:hypothetical protein
MNPEVVNIPVPTMLAITKMVAEKKPISLFRSLLLNFFFVKNCLTIQVKPIMDG